ncbi:MAG: hypothetical protein NT051_04420 [Candidatus Micrarchaeota archaeon]|nr:hypothetical protein [Candidatus Micrarchaeota archaeon]
MAFTQNPFMPKESASYAEASKKWKAAAKVVLGCEVGELGQYAEWLGHIRTWRATKKSSISGKEVVFGRFEYPPGASFISLDEVDYTKKGTPVKPSSLQGIDSIISEVSGIVAYAGNIVLGKSQFVEQCSNMIDCNFAYHADRCTHSKYLAYCSQIARSDNIFGSDGIGNSSFCLRPSSCMYCARCLEISKCEHCSDCYYSHGLSGCSDCMFCFNLRSAHHCIGNLQLSPEKYQKTKARLLSEMGAALSKSRKLPTLLELLSSQKPDYAFLKSAASGMKFPEGKKIDKKPIESAFSKTAAIILGKPLSGVDKYLPWLSQHTNPAEKIPSCLSGKLLLLPDHTHFSWFPKDRLLSLEEAEYVAERLKLSEAEAEGITFANAAKAISKIGYVSPEWRMGVSRDNLECKVEIDSTNCYSGTLPINSKYCSGFYWVRESEHIFGGNEVRASAFCMRCYRSERLQRCFEVDSSSDCSDCYFCHNCENVHDSMFCFNAKNLKNAIGNAELPREEYLKVKQQVLEEISQKLDKDKSLGRSIYSLGCKKGCEKP